LGERPLQWKEVGTARAGEEEVDAVEAETDGAEEHAE